MVIEKPKDRNVGVTAGCLSDLSLLVSSVSDLRRCHTESEILNHDKRLDTAQTARGVSCRRLQIQSSSCVTLAGFGRTRSTNMAMASALLTDSSYMVNRIIGTAGRSFFRMGAAWAPVILGIEKSKIIRSGEVRLAFSIPFRPSSASPHTVN